MTSTSEFWLNLEKADSSNHGTVWICAQQFAKLVAENPELDNSKSTAAWLIKTGKLSPYQAKVLLQGRKGPFDFGRYRVSNRISEGSLKGWFQANHIYTGHPVILHFLTGDTLKDPSVWTQLAERVKTAGAIKDNLVWRVFDLVDQVSFRYVVLEDPGVEREGTWSTLADKLKSNLPAECFDCLSYRLANGFRSDPSTSTAVRLRPSLARMHLARHKQSSQVNSSF